MRWPPFAFARDAVEMDLMAVAMRPRMCPPFNPSSLLYSRDCSRRYSPHMLEHLVEAVLGIVGSWGEGRRKPV
eukprot:COSAG05_NODE_14611_length_392_cov_0.819113_1_plen_72_part_01